jgi:hypothetical protein
MAELERVAAGQPARCEGAVSDTSRESGAVVAPCKLI